MISPVLAGGSEPTIARPVGLRSERYELTHRNVPVLAFGTTTLGITGGGVRG